MDLISQIVERAKANKQRIVLPEGTEERTLKAANLPKNGDWETSTKQPSSTRKPVRKKKNTLNYCANFARKKA